MKRHRKGKNQVAAAAAHRSNMQLFSNCVCLMCLSTETKTCLLLRDGDLKGWWLPYVKIGASDSWNEAAVRIARQMLGTSSDGDIPLPQLYHVKRCSFPLNMPSVTVVTFLVTTASETRNGSPGHEVDANQRWFSSDDLFDMVANEDADDTLLGSEPLQFFMRLHEGKSLVEVYEVFSERKTAVMEAKDDREPPAKKRLSAVSELLKSANYGTRERELLYVAFMLKVFPRAEMCKAQFLHEMAAVGWPKETTSSLFLAFDRKQGNFLSFRNFLVGSAVTERCTRHGGPPAEIRCRYIFRYYNATGDGKLKFAEFRQMVSDIRRLREEDEEPPEENGATLDAAATADYELFSKTPNQSLTLLEFLCVVGKLGFRGTSNLLRFDNLLRSFLASTDVLALISGAEEEEEEEEERAEKTT